MENKKTNNRKSDDPLYKIGSQIKYRTIAICQIGVIKEIRENANGVNVFIVERESRKGKFDYEVCEKEIVGIYKGSILTIGRKTSDSSFEGKHVKVWKATLSKKGKVPQYKQGKFIGEFNSIGEASASTGVSRDNILKCCFEDIDGYDKNIFRFVNEIEKRSYFAERESKKEIIHKYGLDLRYLATYMTHNDAAEATNCTVSEIELALDTKGRTAAGFVWRTIKRFRAK